MNFSLRQLRQASLFIIPLLGVNLLNAESSPETFELDLRQAIKAALENNFAFRAAAINPEIASLSITQSESFFDTELFASGQVSQSEQDTTFEETTGTSSDNRSWEVGARKRFSYGTTVTARTNLDRRNTDAVVNFSNLSQSADLSLSIRQPLLNGFGKDVNTAGIQSAIAGYSAASESVREALFELLAETERAYWAVARLQEQLALNESSLKVAETLLKEAQERERVGVATRIDVLQAEASRAQRREEIIETRRILGDAIDQLFIYMGTFAPGMLELESSLKVSGLPEGIDTYTDFAEVWNLAKAQDPLLAQQEAVIDQREWQRRAAKNETRPNLDLVLSGAYTGLDSEDAGNAFDSALDRDGHVWIVGFEFSMPWQMRGAKATLRSAEKELEQENIRLNELQQSLFRQVRSAWRNLDSVSQSLEAAKLTVSLQEATFEREMSKYEEGISVFRDVLEVQRDLDQARIRLLDSKFNRLSSEISIARLSGLILERHELNPELILPDPR
ncbi:TolC family protein [Puniceicoccales bacterium CK1056]|uniref:TolC family protein n=1 Tax=Oceanipulchritudo coccoides TaxID=2706888 RepID=A0A6B2M0Z3_9BACT|nr:TolC family protein [Oceanipulchritudo coccoides]NDV61989.1 TolC family protein [Oceanipulchritudo coccoides]